MALDCLEQLKDQDEPYWTVLAVITAGNLEIVLGRYADAEQCMTQARDLAMRLDNRWLNAWAKVQLGILTVARGQPGRARALLDEGLEFSQAARSTTLVSLCLVGFARLAFAEGDARQAALLAAAAEGLRQRLGMRAWPMMRHSEAELLTQIREAAGVDLFDRMYEAGRRLNQAEAITLATRSSPMPPRR